MTTELKLCKDCKWALMDKPLPLCDHPNLSRINPVYGDVYRDSCGSCREFSNMCGPDGALWEAKDE